MKNKMHILKKIAIVLAICMIVISFGAMSTYAVELDSRTTTVTLNANKRQVAVGDILAVSVNLGIDDEATEGIFTLNMTLTYNPELLTPVDPGTYEEITSEEQSYFQPGGILTDDSLTAEPGKSGKSITLLYGDANSNNIFDDGSLAKLAFRVNPDLAVNNRIDAMIELKDVRIFGRDILEYDESGNALDSKVFEFTTKLKGWSGAIVPKFTVPSISAVTIGDTLRLQDYTSLSEEDGALLIEIMGPDGATDVVASAEAEIANGIYTAEFEIGEAFIPGKYKVRLSNGNTSSTVEFTVKEKYVPPAPPEVDDPPTDEPDTPPVDPEDPDDEGDNNNNNNSNNNGSSHTGGGIPVAPGKDEQTPVDKPVEKPTDVVYPSDIGSHWAEENIKYVYDNKLMNGYEDGTFGAEQPITRAEFATVISRLLGLAEAPDGASFADCTEHWAKGYIGALAAQGIVGGVNDTDFAPDENITREQIAVILSRALKLEEPFDSMAVFMDDDSISDWAYADVYKVLESGYMKGDDLGNFNPLANATRAEVATVIYRLHSAK